MYLPVWGRKKPNRVRAPLETWDKQKQLGSPNELGPIFMRD